MSRNRIFTLLILGVLLVAAGAAWAVFFRKPAAPLGYSPEVQRIMEEIDKANHCKTTDDCVQAAAAVCPFGCYVHVHKDEAERIGKMIADYQRTGQAGGQACMYSCIEYPGVECASGKCLLKEPK